MNGIPDLQSGDALHPIRIRLALLAPSHTGPWPRPVAQESAHHHVAILDFCGGLILPVGQRLRMGRRPRDVASADPGHILTMPPPTRRTNRKRAKRAARRPGDHRRAPPAPLRPARRAPRPAGFGDWREWRPESLPYELPGDLFVGVVRRESWRWIGVRGWSS